MMELLIYINDLSEEEKQWCKNNLNTNSYGHLTYKILNKRLNGNADIHTYDDFPSRFDIIINADFKVPYSDIIKSIKSKFPNCNCYGKISESKFFIIRDNLRLKYDYNIFNAEED